MALEKLEILAALNGLAHRDSKFEVFGASAHQYRLNPALPVEDVESLERHFEMSLPDDYRLFITSVGNGGAGPYYGLFRLGEHDRQDTHCKWEEDSLIGDLSKPFGHDAAWNATEALWSKRPDWPVATPLAQQDQLMEAWDREIYESYWNPRVMDGAIPICHMGCALRQWLVVTGPQRGSLWCDFRADEKGLFPMMNGHGHRVTFGEWYQTWLRDPVHGLKSFQSG